MRAAGDGCPHPPACPFSIVLDLTHDHPLPDTRGRCGGRRLLLTARSTTSPKATAPKAGDPVPGTGHLHGLGVDPADGTLYAAGHLGVFRLGPTGAVRIADRYQDTMGFTVTDPRTFLASGHPSPTDPTATSPQLGLIRSADTGQTWTTVSAGGDAGFHSLQQAGPTLYGLDSQTSQIWASKDGGATWERRAKIPGGDLAAHAGAPQEVWATTRDGLLHSTDGGATFESVPGAPPWPPWSGPPRTS